MNFTEPTFQNYFSIAFYNVENLFDTEDDIHTNDNEFLPDSKKRWTKNRYRNKLQKLGYTLSRIGFDDTKKLPTLIGLAEIENKCVLKDLLASKNLKDESYEFIHFDSDDERGMDVALIYNPVNFEVIEAKPLKVNLKNPDNTNDYTRDILYVHGKLNDETVFIMVNHWPSRREGANKTQYKRMAATQIVAETIQTINDKYLAPKILVMGDFNDSPTDKSIKHLVNTQRLQNVMDNTQMLDHGTSVHYSEWNLFDQILLSQAFFETDNKTLHFVKANIFDERFLKTYDGKYKNTPFRTYAGNKYLGGYSDHFPVYAVFKQ